MTPEEIAKENQATLEGLKSQLGGFLEKKDFEGFQKTVNDFIDKNKGLDVNELKKQLSDVTEKLNEVKDAFIGKNQSKTTLIEAVKEQIALRHDEIKAAFKNKGVVEIDVTEKDPGLVTRANVDMIDAPDYFGQQYAPAQPVNIRRGNIENYVTRLNTTLAAYPYTEVVPKDGDFGFVAEGAIKPKIDFIINTRFATPVKVAAFVQLTEEMSDDIIGIQSIVDDLLRKKHDRKKAKGILSGTGLNNEPKGATDYGRAFVAGAMAGSIEEGKANIMDVINAAITDIYTTHNYEDETSYMANIVMMNPVDFTKNFVFEKDGEGRPLYPTASLFNMVVIGGVTIVPDEDIATGKIFVGDLTKYNITNYKPFTIRIGWINDDFIRNQYCVVGESRFHAFVRKLDEQAFIYDDIATIKAALETGTPSA